MKSAFGIVYDEATRAILVVNGYGAQDITRFCSNVELTQLPDDSVTGVLSLTMKVNVNPDLD